LQKEYRNGKVAKELPLEQALTQAAATRPGSRRAVSEILNVEIWSGLGNRLHLLLPTAKKVRPKRPLRYLYTWLLSPFS
jgi:hypothetical protein